MSKGRFRHPIGIKPSTLQVPYTDRTFVATIIAHDRFGSPIGNIPIAYFGYIENGIFYVVSYSYSLSGFSEYIKESYNTNPKRTAMLGLNVVGIPLRNEE